MKLASVVMFSAGYVMGSKAGRERYAQILKMAEAASHRLEGYNARNAARLDVDRANGAGDGGSRWQEAAL